MTWSHSHPGVCGIESPLAPRPLLCCFAKSFARKQPHDVDWYDTRMRSEEVADGGSNRRRLRFAKRSQSTYEPRVTL